MAETHLELYGYVGEKMWEDEHTINLKDIKAATQGASGPIYLHINSGGGETFEGFAIYDYLNSLDAKIITIIEGLCGSMATIIALVADEVQMMPNAMFFVHKPGGMAFGEEEDLRSIADLMGDQTELAIDIYEAKCGQSRDTIKQWLVDNKFFTAKEAQEVGIVDTIIEPAEAPNGLVKNYRPAMYMDLSFFKRNPNLKFNSMSKNRKSIFAQARKLMGIEEPKMELEITLADATKAIIKTEAEAPEEGDEFTVDGKPAEDKEYVDKDGTKFNVKGGKITSITQADIENKTDEEEEEEETSEEAQEFAETVTAAVSKAMAPVMAELKKVKTELKAFKGVSAQVKEQGTKVTNLSKALKIVMENIESEGFQQSVDDSEFEDDDNRLGNRKTVDMKALVINGLKKTAEK